MSRRERAAAFVLCLLVLVLSSGCASAQDELRWTPGPPSIAALTPKPGDWQPYVLTPRSRRVCPVRVGVTTGRGSIDDPGAITCGGKGVATFEGPAARGTRRLILDFGREMSGALTLRFASGSRPGNLNVAYSESLAYLTAECDDTGADPATLTGRHACPRRVAVGSGAKTWTDPSRRSGYRYVLLTVGDGSGDAKLRLQSAAVARWTALAGHADLATRSVYRGWFLSSDDDLNRYWYDGAYTAQSVTIAAADGGAMFDGLKGLPAHRPVIVDGAKRDRAIWFSMAGPSGIIPMLYGDRAPVRNTLVAMGSRQLPNGFVPGCLNPKSDHGLGCAQPSYTDGTAWWVIALGEHIAWTGDRALAHAELPRALRAVAALRTCQSPDGLITPCFGANQYLGTGDATPSTYMSAITVAALHAAAGLADVAGRPDNGARLRREAAVIVTAVNTKLWDATLGAYRESLGLPAAHPQDANVLTAAWGIAGANRSRRALDYVRRHLWTTHGVRSGLATKDYLGTPVGDVVADWITYYEMLARLERGQLAAVNAMLDKSWHYVHLESKPIPGPQGNRTEPPTPTGWEHIGPGGSIYRGASSSFSHLWSEGATAIATSAFLGVRPDAAGAPSWRVAPHVIGGRLRWAQGRVPTAQGTIDVGWRVAGSPKAPRGLTLDIGLTSAVDATVEVPVTTATRSVSLNGLVVWRRGVRKGDVRLQGDVVVVPHLRGRHVLSWGAAPQASRP